jgi:hypothetical protein
MVDGLHRHLRRSAWLLGWQLWVWPYTRATFGVRRAGDSSLTAFGFHPARYATAAFIAAYAYMQKPNIVGRFWAAPRLQGASAYMRAAPKVLAACVLCGLFGCHESSVETRTKLLQKLRQCLDEVPQTSTQWFYSPCTTLDLTPLKGIARDELLGVLGPPTYCTLANVPKGPDCSTQHNHWSFYNPRAIAVGGGPELDCQGDRTHRCAVVRWVYSE